MDRRTLLKTLFAGGTGAALTGPSKANARKRKVPPKDAVGLLFDSTLCVGCRACVVKCKEVNNLPTEREGKLGTFYDTSQDLSATTQNIIKLYKEGDQFLYVKHQCMHCVDPACVSACMLGALKKDKQGIVTYDKSLCIGCRYCQVACAFNIPKFQWNSPQPRIVKCELCRPRLDVGKKPACATYCPRGAVIFGKRSSLLAQAKQRIKENPNRYVKKIYGESDVGGTQVLYLSAVPFAKLGFPSLGDEPVPELSEVIQHGIYRGFVVPGALYAALGYVLIRNRSRVKDKHADPEKKEGRP
jgi:Fe-S-cluster-containing dehydrogenase component